MELDAIDTSEAVLPQPPFPTGDVEEDYGEDIEYDDDLEAILQAAESQVGLRSSSPSSSDPRMVRLDSKGEAVTALSTVLESGPMDIEDTPAPLLSPFERFRRHKYLSVSDLVGTVWCEVQYDYRLRTLPYLPPDKRPAVITSDKGKEIAVNKVKEAGRERIVRRGQTIHKRLEREIHPEEIVVVTDSREEVWGLRFLNMLAAMEALITLGTCREVPVVGFVGGMLVTGIIDELQRKPIDKSADQPQTRSTRQTALTSFFSPTKPRPQPTITERPRTHKVYVSDSKTRAKDSLPKEEDTLAGQLQCMMYKELLDAMLLSASTSGSVASISSISGGGLSEEPTASTSNRPSARPLAFDSVFRHLSIDPAEPFSDRFLSQSVPIIAGNGLRMGASSARNLSDMVVVWERYVVELGLGTPSSPSTVGPSSPAKSAKAKGKAKADDNGGRTETRLELVYRRAGQKKTKGKSKRRRQDKMADDGDDEMAEAEPGVKEKAEEARVAEEERLVQLAIEESLKTAPQFQEEAAGSEEVLSDPPRPADRIDGTPLADVHVILAAGELPLSIVRPSSQLSEYHMDRTSDEEREDAEIAWAVEMSLVDAQLDDTPGEVAVPLSQRSDVPAPPPAPVVDPSPQASPGTARSRSSSPTPPPSTGTTSGSIIGRHRFQHNTELLERHLASILQYWHGQREPIGVQLKDTGRCGWCEFEEGCEWRSKKAEEDWQRRQIMKENSQR